MAGRGNILILNESAGRAYPVFIAGRSAGGRRALFPLAEAVTLCGQGLCFNNCSANGAIFHSLARCGAGRSRLNRPFARLMPGGGDGFYI